LGDPLKGNLLLFYKPLHLEAQQVSTRIEVRRHQLDIGAIHRKDLCHCEKIGRNLYRGRGRFCDADDKLEFEQGEAF
jgi:hypothetical protein